MRYQLDYALMFLVASVLGWAMLSQDRLVGVQVGGAILTLSTRDPWEAWLVAA